MPARPEKWKEGGGEAVSARKLNLMVDGLTALMDLFGLGGVMSFESPERGGIPFGIRIGKVVSSGPSSTPDWTDERYWVQEYAITPGASPIAPLVIEKKPDVTLLNPTGGAPIVIPAIVTATNIAELPTHAHALPVDTVVAFVGFHDTAQPVPNTRYIMLIGGGSESAPEFDGDVHRGVANGVAGWAPPNVANYTP